MQDAGKAWGLLPAALGLKMEGLSRAVFAPVTLTAALFLGPLAMRAIDFVEERQGRRQRRDEVRLAVLQNVFRISIVCTPHCV